MRWRPRSRAARATTLLLAASLAAGRARAADVTDEVAAEALFQQGRALMAGGEFAQACAKLEESLRLAPGLGTTFNLADCYSHIGRPASAWSLFRDVEAQAKLGGQTARMLVARKRADELEPRLPRLTIRVTESSRADDVRRDGAPIGAAQWDTPLPIDLGEHVITATAPGKRPWQSVVRVTRPGELVTVLVAELEDEPRPAPPRAPAPAPAAALAPAIAIAPGAARRPWRNASIGCGVGGLTFLAASGVTFAIAKSRYQAASPCAGSVCYTTEAVAQRRHALQLGDVATAMAITGGVGVAAAVVLWMAGRGADHPIASSPASWSVSAHPGGIAIRGFW